MLSFYGIFLVIVLKKFIIFLFLIKGKKVNKVLRFLGVYWKRFVLDRDCFLVFFEFVGYVGFDVFVFCVD